MKVCIPLPENILALLAIMSYAYVVDGAIQRKMHGWEVARAVKGWFLESF